VPTRSRAVRPRSLMWQTMVDTFGRRGAQFGAAWLCIIVFMGVFAPLLANSAPILMRREGVLSSPLWQSLNAVDLALLFGALALIVTLIVRRARFGEAFVVMLVALAVAFPVASLSKKVVSESYYSVFREEKRVGVIDWSVTTLIPYSPSDRMRDMPERRLKGPSWNNLLGTNQNGEDIASGMIHACRIALSIGLISTSIALSIGMLVGGAMGYYGKWIDLIGMRLIEIFEAIPTLLVLITIMAAYGRGIYLMMAVIGLLSWTGTARFVRAEFLRLRTQDFVQAAVASGLRESTIIYRHILPNGLTPVLVTATFSIASAILTEALLSYLGLGLVDEPSWGRMLNDARTGGQGFVWHMAVFPGLAIFLTVYAYALIGDAMRDALDPKLKKRD
jgi:peptide/nickel transport system permease protein